MERTLVHWAASSSDNSRRLEPTQVGGFNQTYRSISPEAYGITPATSFETFSIGIDHRFPTRTYVNLDAEWLRSDADRTIGTLSNSLVVAIFDSPGRALENIKYDERSATLSVNQLLGEHWAIGVRYRISEADSRIRFAHVSSAVAREAGFDRDDKAVLQQVNFSLHLQSSVRLLRPGRSALTRIRICATILSGLDGDSFWQVNVFVGYRFWRRHAEARVGVLNIGDR